MFQIMDQSTQVNFPIVTRNPQRHIKRHNTSADLYQTHLKSTTLSSSWVSRINFNDKSERIHLILTGTFIFSRVN